MARFNGCLLKSFFEYAWVNRLELYVNSALNKEIACNAFIRKYRLLAVAVLKWGNYALAHKILSLDANPNANARRREEKTI